MTGMTTLQFSASGRVAKGWWEFKRLRLLRQLGVERPDL
jgi:hypothetical protein